VAPRLDVRVGPLLDHAVALEARVADLDENLKQLKLATEALRSMTSGAASEAAVAANERAIAEAEQRKDRLNRNAQVIRNLCKVYDACDLAGARALGE